MRRETPSALLQRYVDSFVAAVPEARRGDETAVHRARVASRRLREALPVLAPDTAEARPARRRVRRVTRALGPVRELDVALAGLDAFGRRVEGTTRAVALVRRSMAARREARRGAMLDILTPGRLARLGKPGPALVDAAAPGVSAGAASRARVARRASALAAAIEYAGSLYLPDRIHAVRIAAKKLRYGLELHGRLGFAGTAGPVRRLKAAQDLLGHLHDMEILLGEVRVVATSEPGAGPRSAPGLERLARAIEDECRTLHARYVSGRDALAQLARTAEAMNREAGEQDGA